MKDRGTACAIALAVCAWGCSQENDAAQYKTYGQLLTDQKVSTSAAADEGSASASESVDAQSPVSAAEADNAAADATPVVVTESPAASNAVAAPDSNGPIAPKSLTSFVPKPGGIQVLVPETSFRADARTGALRVSYDDLDLFRVLNMEPVPDDAVEYFPEWLKELDGKRIRIRGFMRPGFESAGLEGFVLMRDTGLCCFGPNAKIYYLIGVELQPGKTVDYLPNRPFDVVGNFHIDLIAEGGKQMGLYRMDDAQVITR